MSGDSAAKLELMANQIARNLAYDTDPAAAVADHIDAFWTPKMKADLLARGGDGLDPVARAAIARVAADGKSESTRSSEPCLRLALERTSRRFTFLSRLRINVRHPGRR